MILSSTPTENPKPSLRSVSRNTPIRLGVIMDAPHGLKVYKDTTLALIMAAQRRGWTTHVIELADLALENGRPGAWSRTMHLRDTSGASTDWCDLGEREFAPLEHFDVILMRKDPPFDMEYIHATYLLQLAENAGVLVVNKPQGLRDCNEKVFACHFPQCCPPTLVSRNAEMLRAFRNEHRDIVIKPLDGMGGEGVFRLPPDDRNFNVAVEMLSGHGRRQIMAQLYLPSITAGDKRILMIDGEPVDHALVRIPAAEENRANMATGGVGKGHRLTARDRWICSEVGPELVRRGLLFVGLDVIGDYLTEINVTSPTGIREIDRAFGVDTGARVIDAVERHLTMAVTVEGACETSAAYPQQAP